MFKTGAVLSDTLKYIFFNICLLNSNHMRHSTRSTRLLRNRLRLQRPLHHRIPLRSRPLTPRRSLPSMQRQWRVDRRCAILRVHRLWCLAADPVRFLQVRAESNVCRFGGRVLVHQFAFAGRSDASIVSGKWNVERGDTSMRGDSLS